MIGRIASGRWDRVIRRRGCLAALLLASLLASTPAAGQEEPLPVVRVGVVVDGPWEGNEMVLSLTTREVLALTAGEFDVRLEDAHYRVADWTLEGVQREIDRLLADPAVDVVITWGVLASHTLCCRQNLEKPVLAPIVFDVALQGIPYENGVSGRHNLSYVALPDNLVNELRTFLDIVPFRRLAFLANGSFLEGIPEMRLTAEEVAEELGIDFVFVPVGARADEALAGIGEDIDAVYVWPQFHMRAPERQRLVDGLIERKLPSFSALGGTDVEAGMLASMGADDFFPRLARRIALNLQRILLGEEAGSLPVAFAAHSRLSINLATAHAIGVSPRWEMLTEAELLEADAVPGSEPLSFEEAVLSAVDANLDLLAEQRAVWAGAQDVARARSAYLPQLETSATGLTLDDDRAGAGQAERSVTGQLRLSQLIYGEEASANTAIQRSLQTSREQVLEQVRLDVALDAAVAYLNLLRAKTLADVQRSNLALTRSNLERATIRRSVGVANAAEVFRWESQVANDRQALIEAVADVRVAEIALNRLLDRDLETTYRTESVDLENSTLITSEARFDGYIETPRHFRVMRDFAVAEGLAAAPELRQLEASIAAQERQLLATKRSFYLPTVAAEATLDELLADGGVGSDLAGPGIPDDTNWTLALSASLSLFTGGARRADRIQAEETLRQLQLQLAAATDRIEQRIRTAMMRTRASFSGIELSRQASAAARSNLELVADSYSRGAVSIIDLLDAQNAALGADRAATNAVHDFLTDLMEVQRAANQFDFFTSPAARDAWFVRLEGYFSDAGVVPWPRRPNGGEERE